MLSVAQCVSTKEAKYRHPLLHCFGTVALLSEDIKEIDTNSYEVSSNATT
jgi:hypothetical protein